MISFDLKMGVVWSLDSRLGNNEDVVWIALVGEDKSAVPGFLVLIPLDLLCKIHQCCHPTDHFQN